jgi:hypothetical protein
VTTEISCPLVHLKGDLNIRDKNQLVKLERVEGIEPSYSAWKTFAQRFFSTPILTKRPFWPP